MSPPESCRWWRRSSAGFRRRDFRWCMFCPCRRWPLSAHADRAESGQEFAGAYISNRSWRRFPSVENSRDRTIVSVNDTQELVRTRRREAVRDRSSDWAAARTAKVHFVTHGFAQVFDLLDEVVLTLPPRRLNLFDRLDRQKIIGGAGEKFTRELCEIFSREFATHRRKL